MGFSLELQRKKKWKKGLDGTQREREGVEKSELS
jgi:hypothetical protein